MTWLITGGCGFIGSNLADTLLTQGEQVILFDNLSRFGSSDNLEWLRKKHGKNWEFIQSDIRDTDEINKVIRESSPTVIAHLAGQVAMTTSLQNPRLDFEINGLGTLNVLEAVRLYSMDTIVLYSSTNKVYGSLDELRYREMELRYELTDHPNGLNESLQLDGQSPYGCSKLTGDQYVRDYSRMFGLRTVVFRHSSMYGGRQFATYDQGWIGWFCQKAIEMEYSDKPSFTISGDGKQVRDVLHARDLVQVYMQAVEHINNASGQIYNIGGGMENSLSLLELFGMLETFTGFSMRFETLKWRHGDQKVFVADVSKATHDFGWKPSITKKDGIREMLAWSREIYNGN
ncbi:MAG: GDP-mannose 4,6-dehydratase [Anaerolineales bacterium]|nr:GDP-mannose 4,6-dehydratase [Anaerolineales bacterium]